MKNLKSVLAISMVSLTLVACGGGDKDPMQPQLRAVHLSPDAPAVNISADGAIPAALMGVEYRQASPFLTLSEGSVDLSVLVPALNNASALDVKGFGLDVDTKYTVIAANTVANGLPLTPIVLEDDIAKPAAGFAAVTVVHGSTAAQAVATAGVDVYVTAPGAHIGESKPLLTAVMFKDASGEVPVAAGNYQIRITPTGSKTVVYDSGTLPLVDGVEYVAIAADDIKSESNLVGLTILTDLPSTPFLNVDNQQ